MIWARILLFGMFLLTSCNSDDDIPAKVLPPEKMQAVLWDVIKADAFTKDFVQKDSATDAEKENRKLQEQVFAIHKISRETFYNSFDFYRSNTKLYKQVLDTIISRAGREKMTLTNPPLAE